ncbi:hypothetical protein A0H81_04010 [Grifola frondosa]|uniref:Uncharacterized protein n=1 Tax=Grifola frondosa TaxID=5627 RepID=A0A1C7MJV0_GRIFR|nr:hypothetical protein A0H81_04010 [Grifola frondosa]
MCPIPDVLDGAATATQDRHFAASAEEGPGDVAGVEVAAGAVAAGEEHPSAQRRKGAKTEPRSGQRSSTVGCAQSVGTRAPVRPYTHSCYKALRLQSTQGAFQEGVPPIALDANPAASSNAPVAARGAAKRRRSSAASKTSAHSASSKKALSTEPSLAQLREKPAVAKDIPPHLVVPETPSFDIKHDIDALVERVRAVAMDRPNTPGSHIDWAGEEDDSLPDLDDWGYTTELSHVSEKVTLISPILEDALRPLPSLDAGTPTIASNVVVNGGEAKRSEQNATPSGAEEASTKASQAGQPNGKDGAANKRSEDGALEDGSQSAVRGSRDPSSSPQKTPSSKASPQKAAAKLPFHPSLPPKPVTTFQPSASKRPARYAVSDLVQSVAPPERIIITSLSEGASVTTTHAPGSPRTPSEMPSGGESSPERAGLPPLPPAHFFHAAHGRSRTVGRPAGFRAPYSPPADYLNSDRGRIDKAHHARTQSSPPTGTGSRAAHATRPVITVNAISMLARSLGGNGGMKREAASVAAVKD